MTRLAPGAECTGAFRDSGYMPKPSIPLPPRELLLKQFEYDPETGRLLRGGKVVGTKNSSGYLTVSVGNRGYLVHRIIWHMIAGDADGVHVDHINGDKFDNRLVNLRVADNLTNAWNKVGKRNKPVRSKGVRLDKDRGNYRATIVVRGKAKNLGRFRSEEQAAEAYARASVSYFGFYANQGEFTPKEERVAAVSQRFVRWRERRQPVSPATA